MNSGLEGSTGTKKVDGSQLNVRIVPAATGGWRFSDGVGAERVSLGRRMMGSVCGQETMNICARLYANTPVSAVSKGVGKGEAPRPARR